MTIASKLETINEALGDIKSSIEAKGVTPSGDITTFSTAIESISTGDEITATNTTGSAIASGDKVWVNGEDVYTRDFTLNSYQGSNIVNDTNKTFISTGSAGSLNGQIQSNVNKSLSSLEICLKWKTNQLSYNTSINMANIFGDSTKGLQAVTGIHIAISSTGDFVISNTYGTIGTIEQANINSWNKIKIVLESGENSSTDYSLYVFENNAWTLKTSGTNNTVFGDNFIDSIIKIGTNTYVESSYGTIICEYDLSECYVKIDGNTVWTPYTKTGTTYSIINDTDITSTSFTGVAQEAIANNATGAVKTLLEGNGTYAPTLGTKTITTNNTYTASAEDLYGYSSVTVNVSSGGKYQLLDRVKDDSNNEIGTVSGFFTDANNVEYAVVCLDAQYRLDGGQYCSDYSTVVTNLPVYNTSTWGPWEAKETATFNTQKILDFCAANSYTSTACSHCRSQSFTIDGTTYYGQLPNMIELNDIVRNHTAINTADTTASSYTSVDFASSKQIWSSSQHSGEEAWLTITYTGNMGRTYKHGSFCVAPVLEIPNT